ncbi:MAG TPA: T9SS type A sorting domain-containing protein [Rhodothermales bacterium]|nr:T9SS type A sorting domain-containing protein [Rhodothermales bacterium]
MPCTRFFPSIILAVLLASPGLLAQDRVPFPTQAGKPDPANTGRHWCATPWHVNSPEGQAALRRFHEARAVGTLPRAAKSEAVYEIGSMEMFNVITDSIQAPWKPAQFELKATGTRFNLWLRADQPDILQVSDSRIEALRVALEESTPERSYDPTKGVLEIDEEVFGQSPIYPGGSDGVVDILVYDLPSGIAGFVSPTDIDPFADAGEGNQREVLHIWIRGFESTSDSQIESVIGHEYQHLIHLNYDVREIQFVNEGLSEYAQLLLGYQAIIPYHLLVQPPEFNISFFSWRTGTDDVILDYARGSTWHGYLGDQLGPALTGSMTRHPQIGLEGYKEVLADAGFERSMDDLIVDFYTALIVNDLDVDPRFGIVDPVRTSQIDIQIPSNRRFDGSRQTEANLDSLVILPGGAEYFEWLNVSDFEFTFDVKAGPDLIVERRQHARLRVIAEPISGDLQVHDYSPSPDSRLVEGDFKKVTLVAANVRPEVSALPAFLHSYWSAGSLQIVSYAYGQEIPFIDPTDGPLAFSMASGPDGAIAVRFPVPPGGQLNDAELGIFHFNEFGVGSANAPRDYVFTVWDNGGGEPGEVIYSEVYENPNPAQRLTVAAYQWQSFQFSPPLSKIGVLPDTVYIGAREVGTDENFIVVWPARANSAAFPNRRVVDTGYIGGVNDAGQRVWVPSWEITFTQSEEGDRPLRSTALPVRARFIVDPTTIAVEDEAELPARIALVQNFPNPFNPSTRIQFAIPNAEDVLLKVFDMAGREVTTLIDGSRPAGTYNVTLNATDWASGVYVYRLQAGDRQIARRMILLK